jgi:hypothetical protein
MTSRLAYGRVILMFIWIILAVLLIMLIGSAPAWPHSRRWGYSPAAIIALLLILFLCMWIFSWPAYMGHHPPTGGNHMHMAPMHQ